MRGGGGKFGAGRAHKLERLAAAEVKIFVRVESAGPSKGLGAKFAKKRLLTCVETLVCAEVVLAREGALTDRTLKRVSGFWGHGGGAGGHWEVRSCLH